MPCYLSCRTAVLFDKRPRCTAVSHSPAHLPHTRRCASTLRTLAMGARCNGSSSACGSVMQGAVFECESVQYSITEGYCYPLTSKVKESRCRKTFLI
jgi:hypothetical protein